MAHQPSLDDVIVWLRDFWSIRDRQPITAETKIEANLGVTGDDGEDLLIAAMEHFSVNLACAEHGIVQTLQLGPNECFLGPEGWLPLPKWLGGSSGIVYRDLTVGELHQAILQAPDLKKHQVDETT